MYASNSTSVTRKLLQRLLYFVLPAPCLACNAPLFEPRDTLGLCPSCRDLLVRWPSESCPVCGRDLTIAAGPEGYRCGNCRRSPPPFECLHSAWSYRPPLDVVLTGLKFKRLDYLGSQLGRRLADLFQDRLASCEVVVPVPLHWSRYLQRGYNQAEVIARPLAAALGRPIRRVLCRRRSTPAQSRLSRARRQRNLVGAFSVRRPAGCLGRHVLLVDDVVTTGTTITTAAECLMRAGAGAVTVLAVARTPESWSPRQCVT